MTDNEDWASALEGPTKKPMKRRTKIFLWVFAATVAWFTLSNASFLAPDPTGKRVLIAHRGVSQLFDHTGVTEESCTATRIHPPGHDYIENSLPSMKAAIGRDAGMVKFDVAGTKDGQVAVFHDWTLDCRTDGKGEIRDHTMAQLKALDIGYGYTADGGQTYPLRGKGVGLMPSLDEVLRDLGHASLLINFKSRDPEEAERVLAAFARAGIDPNDPRFDTQWAYSGWPDRLQDRAAKHGTRILLTGPRGDEKGGMGLSEVNQLTKVPASFTGYVWIDDIYNLGPALRPRQR